MHKIVRFSTLAALVWTYVLFPAASAVHAQEQETAYYRDSEGATIQVTKMSDDNTVDARFTNAAGETMNLSLSVDPASVDGSTPAVVHVVVDNQLEWTYTGARTSVYGNPKADLFTVRFGGQEKSAFVWPAMLNSATGDASQGPPEAYNLLATGMASLHSDQFYTELQSTAETAVSKGTTPGPYQEGVETQGVVVSDSTLPDSVLCVLAVIGWLGSWTCFASCALVWPCLICIGAHAAASISVAAACAPLKK